MIHTSFRYGETCPEHRQSFIGVVEISPGIMSLYWPRDVAHLFVETILNRQLLGDDMADQLRDRLRIGSLEHLRREFANDLPREIADEFSGEQQARTNSPSRAA